MLGDAPSAWVTSSQDSLPSELLPTPPLSPTLGGQADRWSEGHPPLLLPP